MGMKETIFYNKVLPIALERIDEANSIDLATIAQTLVLLKNLKMTVDSNLVKSIMNSVSKMCLTDRIISEISATNSVLILYSFAKLNIFDEVLFPRLLELIKDINKENFEPHLIPLVLYVLSIFKINDFSCLSVIFEYITEYSHMMKHENLSNCLSSMARLNIRNYSVIRELVQNIKKLLPSIRVRELANVMWSLSKLKYDDSDFINDCFNRVKEYDYIDPMSHAQIFETIKRCNFNKKDIVDHLLRKYIPIMRESPTQVITQVAWCCYVLNLNKYNLIEDSLEELSRRELNKVELKYLNKLCFLDHSPIVVKNKVVYSNPTTVNIFKMCTRDVNSCVTRVRFSPQPGDSLAVAVDSAGYIRMMDLKAQKSSNYKYLENIFMENDVNLPHLCDFSFSNSGRCVYVSSSDGFVTISALNMVGKHLNKDNNLLTIHDTYIGGTFCVYPTPEYDFMIYTGGGDGFLRLWDLRLMSTNNKYNSQRNSPEIKAWNKPLVSLWAHVAPLSSMSLNVPGKIITCGFNENIRVWDSNSLVPIQTIDGGCGEMGVWDLIVDDKSSKMATVGDSSVLSTFEYECDEESFVCKNHRKIMYENCVNDSNLDFLSDDQILFMNWRRICQYGNNLVIPSLNSVNSVKAFILDISSGNIIDNLSCQSEPGSNNRNISSVDVHPNPDVGLILSGGLLFLIYTYI
uniref:Uncharacterized protein n=1 Tax=Theileria annulata TaxID=5874 RepID=A0A3B0MWL3_THEAN